MARLLSLLLLLTPVVPVTAWAGTILVVGDSLSAAYGLPVEEGWVDLLQERLDARYGDWNLINASISGDTTAGARARLPQAMQRHHPDILILELGGNDGLRGLPLPEMKANLSAMIGVAREHRSRVLLIGMQLPPNYGRRYTERFEQVYRELANEQDVELLPSLVADIGTRAALMQADGIHPNAAAQPLIMDRVWRHLQPLLEDKVDRQGRGASGPGAS